MLGTKHGYDTPYFFFIIWYSYFELAICGTHFGETNEPTYTLFKPLYVSLFINVYFVLRSSIFFSFWRPSRGPTSTIFTNEPMALLFYLNFKLMECLLVMLI